AGFSLEDFHEFAADDLALGFWVGHAGQLAEKLFRGVDVDDLDAEVTGKGVHDLLGLIEAQQAVIDEDARELVADGFMDQGGRHRGVHAARQAQNDLVAADLLANALYGFLHVVRYVPVERAAADFDHKAGEHGFTLSGVGDFRMELNAVEAALFVRHTSNGAAGRGSHEL